MRKWKTLSKAVTYETGGLMTQCNIYEFGGKDPFPGQKKQFWCEVAPSNEPSRCAFEGEDCMCNGNVYYMAKGEEKRPLDFFTASEDKFTVNTVNNTQNVTCASETFEDTDPLPGEYKQCFCDNDKSQGTPESVEWVKNYWRNVKIQR